jgi:hypothetical protein
VLPKQQRQRLLHRAELCQNQPACRRRAKDGRVGVTSRPWANSMSEGGRHHLGWAQGSTIAVIA